MMPSVSEYTTGRYDSAGQIVHDIYHDQNLICRHSFACTVVATQTKSTPLSPAPPQRQADLIFGCQHRVWAPVMDWAHAVLHLIASVVGGPDWCPWHLFTCLESSPGLLSAADVAIVSQRSVSLGWVRHCGHEGGDVAERKVRVILVAWPFRLSTVSRRDRGDREGKTRACLMRLADTPDVGQIG